MSAKRKERPVFMISEVHEATQMLLAALIKAEQEWITKRNRAGKVQDGAVERLALYAACNVLFKTFGSLAEELFYTDTVKAVDALIADVTIATGSVDDIPEGSNGAKA